LTVYTTIDSYANSFARNGITRCRIGSRMKYKHKDTIIDHAEASDRNKLKAMTRVLSECQGMAHAMELETLAYLLEMSILEAKLQIEIDDYS